MTVYNINLGIGWASSGVEYAQAYRAQILRRMQQPAKFIFMDMILERARLSAISIRRMISLSLAICGRKTRTLWSMWSMSRGAD